MKHFAAAYSDKPAEDAIREISLQIKDEIPWIADLAMVFYTPHYKPTVLQNMLEITLRPGTIIGIKAPLLIYEDKVIAKGIVTACFRLNNLASEAHILDDDAPEKLELSCRDTLRRIQQLRIVYGFLSSAVEPRRYVQGIKMALGKNAPLISAGYFSSFPAKQSHILNSALGASLLYLAAGGDVNVCSRKIESFVPLGKPFTFTKIDPERRIILEIDNRPAAEIYKKYLDEKFALFKKTEMFRVYPLSVMCEKSHILVTIKQILPDDSLLYTGDVQIGQKGNVLLYNEEFFANQAASVIASVQKTMTPQLAIIFNSLLKQDIMKSKVQREITHLKEILGDECCMVGIYSDYHISRHEETRELIQEEGAMHATFWQA